MPPPQKPTPTGVLQLTVDPLRGDDDAASAAAASAAAAAPSAAPSPHFRTIGAAVEASRGRLPGQHAHIELKGGTHFLTETVELGAANAYLTIRNADGERARGGERRDQSHYPLEALPPLQRVLRGQPFRPSHRGARSGRSEHGTQTSIRSSTA